MSVSKLAEFGVKHVARGIGRLSNQVLESGAGSYVTTTEGRKMLDFTCGIGVTNLGHCHPAVTKAAQEQVGKLVHGQVNIGKSCEMVLILRLIPSQHFKSPTLSLSSHSYQ